MTDLFNVVIVGHDLQAKCDVANGIIKQKDGFRQFKCRQNILAKAIVGTRATPTVAGRKMNIVLTPNLNTPCWIQLRTGIKEKYDKKAFIYVKSHSMVDVDDTFSIQNIKEQFPRTMVYVIAYINNLSDLVKPDGLCTLTKGMTLTERNANLNCVLTQIGKDTQVESTKTYSGNDEVGTRPLKSKVNPQDSTEEEPAASSPGPSDNSMKKEEPVIERQNTDELDINVEIKEEDVSIFYRTLQHGRAKSNHVRANVIGNQGAGKTTLIKRLHDMDVTCPNIDQPPTEALNIAKVTSRCVEINGEKCWESRSEGYMEDLNYQRLGTAMKRVENNLCGKRDEENDDAITAEDFEGGDYMYASDVIDDIEITNQDYYALQLKKQIVSETLEKILIKKRYSKGEKMYVSYWDFAGQSTYYSTHQVFMSPSAVYVLVVDLSQDFKEKLSDSLNFRSGFIKECSVAESLMFWVSSIKAFTTDKNGGKAPIIIVGTHVDKLKKMAEAKKMTSEDLIKNRFDEVREITKMSEVECIAVDNTLPDKTVLCDLRNRILELGLGVIDEEIHAQWVDLDMKIQEERLKGKVFMSFEELQKLDKSMDVPITSRTRLEAFLGHQHNRGHLIYFPHEELNDFIILEPDVLANFLNTLLRSRDQELQKLMQSGQGIYNHNGLINYNYILEVANVLSDVKGMKDNVVNLIKLLIQLSVMRRYKNDERGERYLIPCLLPQRPEEVTEADANNSEKRFKIVFPDNHMPPTFFHVLIGGLLNEWTLVEKEVNKPEIFNLYACFRLGKATRQLEVYWESSQVYINIKNYSDALEDNQVLGIVEILQKRLEEIFLVYRHINKIYQVRVECPKHKGVFLSMTDLRSDGEAMCYAKKDYHGVKSEDIFGKEITVKDSTLMEKPTERHFGRLAIYLVRYNSFCLAERLSLQQAHVEADRAAQTSEDERLRRLQILLRWKTRYESATVGNLIELLTATGVYQTEELLKKLSALPTRQTYDIQDEVLDNVPTQSILKIATNSIGGSYPFLMLELGLSYRDIQEVLANHPRDLWHTTFTLLVKWKEEYPKTATTRVLLDTAAFVKIDTTEMQKVFEGVMRGCTELHYYRYVLRMARIKFPFHLGKLYPIDRVLFQTTIPNIFKVKKDSVSF